MAAHPTDQLIGVISRPIIANPAVQTDFSYLVPNHFAARIQSCRFTFVTDANAANRQIILEVNYSGVIVWRAQWRALMTAGLTRTFNFFPGAQDLVTTTLAEQAVCIPAFPIVLANGTIRSSIDNMQAGDQISDICLELSLWVQRSA